MKKVSEINATAKAVREAAKLVVEVEKRMEERDVQSGETGQTFWSEPILEFKMPEGVNPTVFIRELKKGITEGELGVFHDTNGNGMIDIFAKDFAPQGAKPYQL